MRLRYRVTHRDMFWTLRHVIPGKWSISPFDANASKVAIEVLELVHMGFLENE